MACREVRGGEPGRFDWPLAFAAEKFLRQRVAGFLERNRFGRELAGRMETETGTDFFEWIDHLVLAPEDEPALREAGFADDAGAETPAREAVLQHPRATLPRVILRARQGRNPAVVALRPEHVADFAARHNLGGEIEGAPFARHRRLLVAEEAGTRLEAVERLACRDFIAPPPLPQELEGILKVREMWRTRRRFFADDADGFKLLNRLLDQSIPLAGRDVTCQILFAEERAYWESRNRAARIQKFRQDRLGLGWGNHDHHTFRSSREHFLDLLEIFQKLGFEMRERFHAGAEAGWGAQILEQPVVGLVVFADADLMPEETGIDFSNIRLPAASRLGTVGLWVGLHGESILGAGMHHLEARFDYERLREQLQAEGVKTMAPFSDFEFLRQAFTEGERWPVNHERVERLLRAGLVSASQCEQFVREGALGSHLENLQRHGGFKGFNQKSVNAVIAATDPRKDHFQGA